MLPSGPDAVLVEVGSTDEAIALYDAGRAGLVARDIVPAARTVLFDGVRREDVEALLSGGIGAARTSAPGHSVEIPTTYDGPDLEETAQLLGITSEELVRLHAGTTFTVAFCGFSPGFAYCAGWDRVVPRLPSPRPRVEPGSVGLAGEFTGVYPSASPGGWRLIGRTDVDLWDPDRDEPAMLTPGTRITFVTTNPHPFG
jgi:KipI family sensor histidine kinase inhibitor